MPTWRQIHEFPRLFRRGNRYPVCTVLTLIVVCGYGLQWISSFWDFAQVQTWLRLNIQGLRGGCLWQLFTYSFLNVNPFGAAVIIIGLMTVGRELENIIGPKQVLCLVVSATVLPGLAGALHSSDLQMVGAWPALFAVVTACTEVLSDFRLCLPLCRLTVRYRFLGATLFAVLFTSWLLGCFPFRHASPYANLLGAGIGWLHVRFLGFGTHLPGEVVFRKLLIERQRIAQMPMQQYISEFVDPVLEKIHSEGVHRLKRSERRILRKARQKARCTLL
jgi:membrane associated rhomboid family serine protease